MKVATVLAVGTVIRGSDQRWRGLANDLAIADFPTSVDSDISACNDASRDDTDF
jgi:hypothetical protein